MMKYYNDFAAFILSHGRADRCKTYDSLRKAGYSGKIYILIDNEDKTAKEYYDKYGDQVIMFDKAETALTVDTIDNFEGRKAIVYARNANFKIAQELGLKYFLQLDDDYHCWVYKFRNDLSYKETPIRSIDSIFDSFIDCLNSTNIKSLAFAQTGDFIGGGDSGMVKNGYVPKRKAMNTWFFKTDNPIKFIGKMNEDFTASVYYGSLGNVFMTIMLLAINQVDTQAGKGGMSDLYNSSGTYVKTFYSVIAMPSAVKVSMMGETHRRLHHLTNWNAAVPKIIRESNKK